jgi:precorrin-2 dehydrogenase/sirohydrochlorin ferrochelatase
MLIDLYLKGKEVVVFGGGNEAELKVLKVLDDCAKVTVVSKEITSALRQLADERKIRIIEYDLNDGFASLKRHIGSPYVVFLATDDRAINKKGADFAKRLGAIVCVVDTPELCDFAMPAIAKVGDIRIGISTGGRSPVIAKLFRQKIEKMLTKEDLLQLELQEYARRKIRPRVGEFRSRKKFLWKVVENDEIQILLKQNKLDQAKNVVDRMVEQVV